MSFELCSQTAEFQADGTGAALLSVMTQPKMAPVNRVKKQLPTQFPRPLR